MELTLAKDILLTGSQLRKGQKALRLVIPLFKKYRFRILCGFIALLGVDLLQLLIPREIKSAVDSLQFANATSASLLRHSAIITGFAIGIA